MTWLSEVCVNERDHLLPEDKTRGIEVSSALLLTVPASSLVIWPESSAKDVLATRTASGAHGIARGSLLPSRYA